MRRLSIIGIGAGNPDYITLQAVKALETVDAFFVIDKGEEKDDLAKLRREICERYIKKRVPAGRGARSGARPHARRLRYGGRRRGTSKRAAIYEALIRDELGEDEYGAFLVWGDPSLYDSTLRIVEQVAAMETVAFELRRHPRHHQRPGAGRAAPDRAQPDRRAGAHHHRAAARRRACPGDDVVVMLDGDCAFKTVQDERRRHLLGRLCRHRGRDPGLGQVAERSAEIERVRAEARERKGWIMDTYLLRKT